MADAKKDIVSIEAESIKDVLRKVATKLSSDIRSSGYVNESPRQTGSGIYQDTMIVVESASRGELRVVLSERGTYREAEPNRPILHSYNVIYWLKNGNDLGVESIGLQTEQNGQYSESGFKVFKKGTAPIELDEASRETYMKAFTDDVMAATPDPEKTEKDRKSMAATYKVEPRYLRDILSG